MYAVTSNEIREIEVKIPDIDKEKIKKKLEELGATSEGEVIQQVYTYDMYSSGIRYNAILDEIGSTDKKVSLDKVKFIFRELSRVICMEDNKKIRELTGFNTLKEYADSLKDIDEAMDVLTSDLMKQVANNAQANFFKWIRLRRSGEKITLTLKQIFSSESEYNIDDVKELEFEVDSLEMANQFLEEIGYSKRRYIEKKRTSFKYHDLTIEIDEWPLIPPYMEIEGPNAEGVYAFACKLGFKEDDCRVMNTDDVYKLYGLDLESFRVLTFDIQEK